MQNAEARHSNLRCTAARLGACFLAGACIWAAQLPASGAQPKSSAKPPSWHKSCDDSRGLFCPSKGRSFSEIYAGFRAFIANVDNQENFWFAGLYYEKTNKPQLLRKICQDALKRHPDWAAPQYF